MPNLGDRRGRPENENTHTESLEYGTRRPSSPILQVRYFDTLRGAFDTSIRRERRSIFRYFVDTLNFFKVLDDYYVRIQRRAEPELKEPKRDWRHLWFFILFHLISLSCNHDKVF